MLWTPKAPALAPRPLGTPLPRKLPISLHPSCVLALLPQNNPKWFDHSGHGNHGIIHGATPTAKGPEGFAWKFDGVDDWIDCGNDLNIIGSEMSFGARIRFSSLIGDALGIINKGTAWNTGYSLLWVPPMRWEVAVLTTMGNFSMWPTTPPVLDTWTNYWISYNGTTLKFYIDGREDHSTPASGDLVQAGLPSLLVVGRENWGGGRFFFPGLIDYVLIYNQAWSPRPQDANYLPEIDPHL